MKGVKKYLPIVILALFVLTRLPGLGIPYYQDEWKNVASSASVSTAGTFFAHPPLFQILFVAAYKVFGMDWFRLLPLIISACALWLLFACVQKRAGENAGLWAMLLGAVSFYGFLGSLQPDVDGSVLPLLFLAALYSYDRAKEVSAGATLGKIPTKEGKMWTIIFTIVLLAGFLVKLNFILVIGVFILDWLWENRKNRFLAHIGLSVAFGAVLLAVYVGLLYLIQALYPAFSISFMLGHANQYASAGGRNWLQIAVQSVKAVYYLSPLLIAPLIFVSKEVMKRSRPFLIYLIAGAAFYLVAFDFSQGALDKYLMFAIAPLAAIGGMALSDISFAEKSKKAWGFVIGIALTLAVFALNFAHPIAVALYPKAEWFGRVLHGHWNILTPITGGSGPMGFYVSFMFIAVSFIVAIIFAILGRVKRSWLAPAALTVLLVGIGYNIVFAEEYMFGKINGSSAEVLSDDVAFISQSGKVDKVITYNDTGAGSLSLAGKYAGRIYATPDSEVGYRARFSSFDGKYLVVDVPRLYGFYEAFFKKCTILYQSVSKSVSGTVYDCPNAAGIVKSL